MAGEYLDELLVKLGLETDAQSFRQANSLFAGVTRAAWGFSAAISAGLGGAALTTRLAKSRHAFAAQADALGLSAEAADRLGFALEQAGGSADNALNVLQTMRDLRDQAAYGEGELFGAGMFGIDVDRIITAQDEMAALLELSRQFQGLSDVERNRALDQLGISGTGIQNLLRGGPDVFGEQLALAAELRTLTEEEVRLSRQLNQSMGELSRAMDELNDNLVTGLGPHLVDAIDAFTGILTGNIPNAPPGEGAFVRGADGGADLRARQRDTSSVSNEISGMTLLEAIAQVESGGRHRDASGRLITSPLGAQGMYQIIPSTGRDPGYGVMPLQNNTQAEHERFAQDYLGALAREFESEELATIAYNAGPGTLERWLSESDDWRESARRDLQSDVDHMRYVASQALEYELKVEGVMGRELRGGTIHQTNHFHIQSNDPDAVGREVDRRISHLSQQSSRDLQNGVD
ncbi:transglycosylase SLT domain-containing protein [Halomonas salifodinae]|uniref:Transglycosylase SLT domain-containing protein n=1 Tax=Halomonas salifodinae TaxID=438745 RepID=A0ABW2EZQ4_9GAMM